MVAANGYFKLHWGMNGGYLGEEQKRNKCVCKKTNESTNKKKYCSFYLFRNTNIRRLLCYLFFMMLLVSFKTAYAQDSAAFNQIYDKTSKETAQRDLNKALAVADSLYQISQKSIFKTRCLILAELRCGYGLFQ